MTHLVYYVLFFISLTFVQIRTSKRGSLKRKLFTAFEMITIKSEILNFRSVDSQER